jgi:molybdopterin molybdotransferase
MNLLPVEEAQRRLLALAAPLFPEQAALDDAAGRWLSEPLAALRDQPWTDLSAMDGYAIRWADMPGPWVLAGEIQAGALPPEMPIIPGTAMRIFTGAPMPPGADAVVLQEDVETDGTTVRLVGDGPRDEWRHVRPKGSDFLNGKTLLPAGTRLGPPQIALAALAGHGALPVRRRPRIVIVSTGDELVAPGAPCPPGRLPASNGAMLRAMVESAGGMVQSEHLVSDDLTAITAALSAARGADIIVTSGGASVGDHDLVRPALEAAGGAIDFWRIAMRPGKPLIVGRLGNAILLGLPGNPVSAMVTGALFLLPLIRHLAGAADPLPRPRLLALGADMPPTAKRAEFVRATVSDGIVTPLAFQDSGAMHAAALADALIYRPIEAPAAPTGALAPVYDWAALGLS